MLSADVVAVAFNIKGYEGFQSLSCDVSFPSRSFAHLSSLSSSSSQRRPLDFATTMYSMSQQNKPMATAAAAPPSLLTQVGMAGTAAVITVSFIHPIDVIKVCLCRMVAKLMSFCILIFMKSSAETKNPDSSLEIPF
jgi:hypothetical protein